jgi:hypothetical protein
VSKMNESVEFGSANIGVVVSASIKLSKASCCSGRQEYGFLPVSRVSGADFFA